jgi:hypothetical protein
MRESSQRREPSIRGRPNTTRSIRVGSLVGGHSRLTNVMPDAFSPNHSGRSPQGDRRGSQRHKAREMSQVLVWI